MDCEQVSELAASYALRALDRDEHAAVAAHIEECGLHGEIAELRATALAVSATAPPRDHPPALRTRLLEAIAEQPSAAAAGASAAAPAAIESRRGLLDFFRARPLWAPYALAAAFAVLAVILGGVLALGGDDGGEALVRDISEGTIEARLVYTADDQTALLTIGGLDPLEADQTYQLWVIRDGAPASVGVFRVSPEGTAGARFEHDLVEGDIVAVTIEPAGGSPLPTSDPLFTTEI